LEANSLFLTAKFEDSRVGRT